MNRRPGLKLRELIERDEILVLPGAHDALTAKLIEATGFEAVYATGAGACAVKGYPDIGLLTMTEVVSHVEAIARATSLPVLADADTGYGGALNVMRAVEAFEQAGVAGIHLEDQVSPKRCGHLEGKAVVEEAEMVGKIRAAVEARRDGSFLIVARVDARGPLGLDEAIRRGQAYLEAGADAVFPEALESREEFRLYREALKGPLIANMTEFGKSPLLSAPELEALGYEAVIFPLSALRVALRSVADFLAELRASGSQKGALHRMATRKELYHLLDYERYERAQASYTPKARPFLTSEDREDA